MACGLVLGVVVAIAVVLLLVQLRAEDVVDSERELKNLALVLSEEVERSLQATESVQTSVIDHVRLHRIETPEEFAAPADGIELHQYLQERVAGLPMIDAIALIDLHGKLVNSSRIWPTPSIDLGDRDYVNTLLTDKTAVNSISSPVRNRLNGNWSIILARKITGSTGQVVGIVACNFDLGYFENIFSHISLDADSSFALYRSDGMLLARFPHVDPTIGRTFGSGDGFNRLLDALDHGAVRRLSMVDGVYRLIVPHSVQHYPLLVAVTSTFQSILKQWYSEVRILGFGAFFVELVIVAIVVLGVRHLRSLELLQTTEAANVRAEAELAVAREREQSARELRAQWLQFNMALSNMHQGLCMFNGCGRLLIANRRFSELFNIPQGAVAPGMHYLELTQLTLSGGLVVESEMQAMREGRRSFIERRVSTTVNWELANGKTITVTHRPMHDGWLTTYEDITERRLTEARIAHMAQHDALTGLPNRLLFREKLEAALAFVRRGRIVAVLCLDLDQFKAVNDTLGHPIGDALLRAVAGRLDGETRETDVVARLGGDEFAIVQSAIDQPAMTATLARRLIELLERPFEVEGHRIVIGTSIGIAFAPQDGIDADRLLRCADLALYRAKADGRGVFRLFHAEMDAQMQARRLLELDLRQALPCDQLALFYQPLMDIQRGRPAGFEALLRWRHPERGIVPPNEFIPLAEEIGLIVAIGEWVLKRACADAASWPGMLKVAVNLSPAQFRNRNLVAAVGEALRESGLSADQLELEITETVMLHDTEATLATLHQLRGLGVRIAMDDFGTGYSSLSYLRRFPFDRIKIDQSFVRELGKRQDCNAIVRAVAAMSNELGMATTAEGVETKQQLEALADIGCTEVQGYYFSPAVPAADVPDLIAKLDTAPARKAVLEQVS